MDWQADGKALEAAIAGEGSIAFVYPENADHVLKFEATPREKLSVEASLHYNASDRRLNQEAANKILNWLIKRA